MIQGGWSLSWHWSLEGPFRTLIIYEMLLPSGVIKNKGREGKEQAILTCSVGQAERRCGRDPRNVGTSESRHWPGHRRPGSIQTSCLSLLDRMPCMGQGKGQPLLVWVLLIGGRRSPQWIFMVKKRELSPGSTNPGGCASCEPLWTRG